MSYDNTRRPQKLVYNPNQPTQPRSIPRPTTTHLHDDFNRLTLNDIETVQHPTSTRPVQLTQPTQRRQHPIWPASPPQTPIPGPAPSSTTTRSRTPCSASNPFQMTSMPLPGTYPVTPIPPVRTLPYQPLVPAQPQSQAQIRTPTPPPGYAERDREQRVRMLQQEQLLQEHWVEMEKGVDSERGIESAQRMQIPSNDTRSTSLMMPPPGFANGSSTSVGTPAPAPATRSDERMDKETIRDVSRMAREMKLERERQRTRRITVRRDDACGEEVQVRGGRDRRETEQQTGRVRDKDKDDDEWEVVRGPGMVMVDDLVDSDDSDTWC